nr:MAG TPA: hypothetical protein [Bacteriophage sp.]
MPFICFEQENTSLTHTKMRRGCGPDLIALSTKR